MSDIRTQGPLTSAHVAYLVDPQISNAVIKLTAGPALPAGQVLAAHAGEYAAYDPDSDDYKTACAVLWSNEPARTAPANAAATLRLATMRAADLTGLDAAARTALAAQFIIMQ